MSIRPVLRCASSSVLPHNGSSPSLNVRCLAYAAGDATTARSCSHRHGKTHFATTTGTYRKLTLSSLVPPDPPGCRRRFQTSPSSARSPWLVAPPQPPSFPPSRVTSSNADLAERTRHLMRLLTSSVVVCTATAPAAGPDSTPVARAMTVSSLTSVSMGTAAAPGSAEPPRPPVVSFNIRAPSQTLSAIMATRQFHMHVLADDVAGAYVADWFTHGNRAAGASGNIFEGMVMGTARVAPRQEEDGVSPPVLEGSGVLCVMKCRVLQDDGDTASAEGLADEGSALDDETRALPRAAGGLFRVRDHVLVLGEVMDIIDGAGTNQSESEHTDRKFGLLYADRHYRQLGSILEKPSKAT